MRDSRPPRLGPSGARRRPRQMLSLLFLVWPDTSLWLVCDQTCSGVDILPCEMSRHVRAGE
jgi:hypothetical protein